MDLSIEMVDKRKRMRRGGVEQVIAGKLAVRQTKSAMTSRSIQMKTKRGVSARVIGKVHGIRALFVSFFLFLFFFFCCDHWTD